MPSLLPRSYIPQTMTDIGEGNVGKSIDRKTSIFEVKWDKNFKIYYSKTHSNKASIIMEGHRGDSPPKLMILGKKSLAQEVRQKRDMSDRCVCKMSNCVTVRPVRVHLTPKLYIAFFIRNLMLNIFLFDNFFEKSCIFRENRKKLFWGRI